MILSSEPDETEGRETKGRETEGCSERLGSGGLTWRPEVTDVIMSAVFLLTGAIQRGLICSCVLSYKCTVQCQIYSNNIKILNIINIK